MAFPKRPLVAFYGDDFTGSSENLAQYHRHGLRAILFLDGSREAEIRRLAPFYDVVGIAGVARSLAPEPQAEEIRPAFALFRELGCRFLQYKICSTFDSSPQVGSFGVALAEARDFWPGCVVAVQAAMPDQGRYTAFGNHFARFGQEVHRLDRHPSMSRHPSTPMDEADLGRHLARQTAMPIRYVTAPQLDAGLNADLASQLKEAQGRDPAALVFDGMTNRHLQQSAALLWNWAHPAEGGGEPVFALAAQGMAHGLGGHLARELGLEVPATPSLEPVERMLVVSGSCAVQTALQIETAEAEGWAAIPLDVARLLESGEREAVLTEVLKRAEAAFEAGRDVMILTARGPDDPTLEDVRATMRRLGLSGERSAREIGQAFAQLVRTLAGGFGLRRIVFSGGDTSSYAVRQMGAFALTIDRFDARASGHVCRLQADDAAIDGLQVLLKGGQIGGLDLFMRAKDGA